MKQTERRQSPRIAERVPLAITDATTELFAETLNVSASGAYCLLDRFIAPMSKLQLRFELFNGSRLVKVSCSGVVVRVDPVAGPNGPRYQTAVFFTELSERNRAAITRFVQRRLTSNR